MFAVFFLAGVILSGALVYAGLIKGELKFSKSTTWTGRPAKIAGYFCLAVMIALLGGIAWSVWAIVSAK